MTTVVDAGHRIRLFVASDATRCCEIIHACLPQLAGLNDAARDLVRAKNVPERLAREFAAYHALVCEAEAGPLGFGCLDGDEIKRFYVLPSAQGVGVGTRLFVALEAEARRRGLRRLTAQASPSSVSFFERCGFERLNEAVVTHGEARFSIFDIQKDLR